MSASPTAARRKTFGTWHRVSAVLLSCLTLAGCTNMGLRGDPFPKDETLDLPAQVRQPSERGGFFGFSNKARQVEKDLGVR